MNLSHNKKMFVAGVILALICSSIATGIYFVIEEQSKYDNFPLPPFDWDFSSSVKLSLQIQERTKNLLYVDVFAGEVIVEENGYSTSSDSPFFNNTFFSFRAWYNQMDKNWLLDYFSISPTLQQPIEFSPENLTILNSGLVKDIHLMYNVTDEGISSKTKSQYIANGMEHISIVHIYEDGSYIKFDIFDNLVFIDYKVFKHYYSTESQMQIKGNIKKLSEYYMCKIDELMPNYTNSVVEFLSFYYNN